MRGTTIRGGRPNWAILAALLLLLGGCRLSINMPMQLSTDFLGNVNGWNLSACGGGGFGTCVQLLMDNEQLIFGGMTAQQTINDAVIGFATTVDRVEVSVAGVPVG